MNCIGEKGREKGIKKTVKYNLRFELFYTKIQLRGHLLHGGRLPH